MVTVLDVAKRAGVSPSTVSRVLSEKAIVAPSTKERVLRAVDELGFEPNRFAQGLRSGKNNTVAFVVGDIEQYVYLQLSQHMQNALEPLGLDLLLFNLGHRGDRFQAILNRAKALRLSGVIIATSDPIDMQAIQRFRADIPVEVCPIVVVGQNAVAQDIPSVWHDDDEAAYIATTYLLRKGCARIAYVGRIAGSAVGTMRYEGYCRALRDRGLSPSRDRVFDCAYRYTAGYASGETIAKNQADFDAVMCGSDEMALGVMAALVDSDLRVPDDVSVVGFGDIEWASFTRPALTTLSTDYGYISAQAAEIIRKSSENSQFELGNKIERSLMIRNSTV